MLARQRPQIKQSGFRCFQPGGVSVQRLGGSAKHILRLARVDQRAVEQGERLFEQRMLGADPVQPPRRLPKLGKATLGPAEQRFYRGQIVEQARALLHHRPFFGEVRLLAGLRIERLQLRNDMGEIVPVPRGNGDVDARALKRIRRRAPARIAPRHPCRIAPAKAVQQRAVPGGVE